MNRLKCAVIGMVLCSIAMAAQQNLSGKVVDETGAPVVGARMELGHNPAVVTTDAEGTFNFGDTIVGIRAEKIFPGDARPVLTSRGVSFKIQETKTPVKVELFDLSGKKVSTLVDRVLDPKRYAIPFTGLTRASAAYVIRVRLGSAEYISHMITSGAHTMQSSTLAGTGSAGFSATVLEDVAAIDTIYSYANGFENGVRPIASYHEVNITITVQSVDTTPPVIKIVNGDTVYVAVGDDAGRLKYWDPNNLMIEVTDNKTPQDMITIIAPTQTSIDATVSGFHEIEYKANDEAYNFARAVRLLVLVDSTVTDAVAPVITLSPDTVRLIRGENYADTGIAISDAIDTHINFLEWVKRSGSILNKEVETGRYSTGDLEAGTYTETYEIMDTHQNHAKKDRVIVISEQ